MPIKERLISAGGKPWYKYGMERFYFGKSSYVENGEIYASGSSKKAIEMVLEGKEKTYKGAIGAINEKVKKKADGDKNITKKDWAKGSENRTYYKVDKYKDAGYFDNKRGIYVPGIIDLSEEKGK